MFDTVDDAGLVATIEEATRAEAAAAALRSAAIGELVKRRVAEDEDDDPRARWVCDVWDSAAAEVAAAMNISHRKASGQMFMAGTLRDRLPRVAALFARGELSSRVVSAITFRTRLITDDQIWALIDAALAARARKWGPLSDEKLTARVDALVERFDPDAVIKATESLRTRNFCVGSYEDEAGVTSIWGRLLATDAAVLDKTVSAMVAGVCENDPRSKGELRADALGAIANRNFHLACRCGSAECPSANQPVPKSAVTVHVVADKAAIEAAVADRGTAVMAGSRVVPSALLREMLTNGAQLQPLCAPQDPPEQRYRPSAKLARFVRIRDLTCRFPGCTAPAELCDIDHVVPYPIGATHPSNLLCLCRKHHLLKTFWDGDWAVVLQPDGTAAWTSPTGRTYSTHPGCRSFFPGWDVTTPELPPPPPQPTSDVDRGQKMPLRQRTRAAERRDRIKAERAQNDSDPPPF
ncbi:DUF222 domain-containing protein [Mycolicibacterium sp. XJ1819]